MGNDILGTEAWLRLQMDTINVQLITNTSERIQISMDKLLKAKKNCNKPLPDIKIIEFEGKKDNKSEITKIGIQKTKNLDMEYLW